MQPSKNIVEETLLAYTVHPQWAEANLGAALARVATLAQSIHADPLTNDLATNHADPSSQNDAGLGTTGVALWHRHHPDRRFPLWRSDGGRSAAFTGVPTGTWRLTGETDPAGLATSLTALIAEAPETIHRLDPPLVVAALGPNTGLTVGADALGVGRLFEISFEGGAAWSNRAGALPLFAGAEPEIDERAWRIFAAAGWFLAETTPFRDVMRVPASTLVRADPSRPGGFSHQPTGARIRLTAPRRATRAKASAEAAAALHKAAAELGRAWSAPLSVALTGGRDSRVSAAAVIAAGVPVRFNTGDSIPGEADVARALVAAAPIEIEHDVYTPDPEEEHSDPLLERIARMHLVHDGLRNPQEVRRPTELPHTQILPPTLSGHGGELGHGFYYPDKDRLRTLRRGGAGPIAALERAARRSHSAATEQGYEEYLDACAAVLVEAKDAGLRGPVLLDYFYAAERLPHRSGLGARSGRTSACTVLEFVRGAFDLKPKQRLIARLHVDVISLLVPEWSMVGFFSAAGADALPELRRRRIWEGREGDELDELIRTGGAWESVFDPGRVREIWSAARSGEGRGEYEHVFYRLAWREAFERHVEALSDLLV